MQQYECMLDQTPHIQYTHSHTFTSQAPKKKKNSMDLNVVYSKEIIKTFYNHKYDRE